MKRLFLVTLLMIAISAIVVVPASAMEACDHEMTGHEPIVAALIAHVQHANDMGHIKTALMPSLMAPLETAADETLPVTARAGALRAFIALVNAQAGKAVHTECATHLVMHAQQVLAALIAQG